VSDFQAWLADHVTEDRRLLVKRLSANDTGATGGHQVGFYVPNRVAFLITPELDSDDVDPRHVYAFELASHHQSAQVRLIYYNSRRRSAGTRNECRITGLGGRTSALQDPINTGALFLVSFDGHGATISAWLCRTSDEEELAENTIGPVIPGDLVLLGADESGKLNLLDFASAPARCRPTLETLPAAWMTHFPSPTAIVQEAGRLLPAGARSVDSVLVDRFDCAYSMFRIIEAYHWLPKVELGFESLDQFLGVAQTLLQRRKARAGRNLEEHLALVFGEQGVKFDAQQYTEPGIRPDFVFPSIDRYRSAGLGDPDLDVLAAKSTLRDRWPSVIREANKIPLKHLFTMDEGIAQPQFDEIAAAGIRLVVPAQRLAKYPASVRPKLWTLQEFIRHRLDVQRVVH
jgi:hypothetical protein